MSGISDVFDQIVSEGDPTDHVRVGFAYRHDDLTLIRDDRNRPVWTMANAITLLSVHDNWQGVLSFDAFSGRGTLLRAIPGLCEGAYPHALEDDDYAAALAWFNQNGFPRATMDIVTGSIRKTCHNRTYDPLQDYLDALEWDGGPRLGSWLARYWGAEASA